jgi:hypothetical protein
MLEKLDIAVDELGSDLNRDVSTTIPANSFVGTPRLAEELPLGLVAVAA